MFFFVVFLGITYFIFYRKVIDFFVISFCSASLYFVSLAWGYTFGPPGYENLFISWEIYTTFFLITFFLIVFSFIFDFVYLKKFSSSIFNFVIEISSEKFYLFIYLLLVFLLTINVDTIFLSKKEALSQSGFSRVIHLVTIYYFSLLMIMKTGAWKVASFILLAYSVLLGSRSVIVFVCLSYFFLVYNSLGIKKIKSYDVFKYTLYSILFLLSIIFSKLLYALIKNGSTWEDILLYISNLKNIENAFFSGSEFLSTQYIYQIIINNNYYINAVEYFYSIYSILPFPSSWLGYSSSNFNDFFQNDLFGDVNYGMGYNPWAEAYSSFGFIGVVFLIIIYALSIYCLQVFFIILKNRYIKLVIIPILVLSSFYFHRNSLGVHLAMIRNYAYIIFFFYLIYKLLPKKI